MPGVARLPGEPAGHAFRGGGRTRILRRRKIPRSGPVLPPSRTHPDTASIQLFTRSESTALGRIPGRSKRRALPGRRARAGVETSAPPNEDPAVELARSRPGRRCRRSSGLPEPFDTSRAVNPSPPAPSDPLSRPEDARSTGWTSPALNDSPTPSASQTTGGAPHPHGLHGTSVSA